MYQFSFIFCLPSLFLLQELFSEVGEIKRYSINYDRSGRSKVSDLTTLYFDPIIIGSHIFILYLHLSWGSVGI